MSEVAEKLRTQLIRDEGRVAHAYPDHLGFLTIGVGHLIDERRGGGLPEFIIDTLLEHDIERVQRQLIAALPWFIHLDPARQGVLVNMGFQLGVAGVLKFAKALAAMKQGAYSEAALHMLDSTWARQTPERAHRLASQMETGVWK